MAALRIQDRADIRADVQRTPECPGGVTKAQLRAVVDALLASMNSEFEAVYARRGRPSVPPEMLLKALLLQILFSIRSERQLVEVSVHLPPAGQAKPHRQDSSGMLQVNVFWHQAGKADVSDPALDGLVHKVVSHLRLHLAGLHRGEHALGEFHAPLGACAV